MSELFHECGVAAIYHLPGQGVSRLMSGTSPLEASRLIPRMLLDIQNRGQLSAGLTTYQPDRGSLLATYKEIGTVQEVFRLSHPGKSESLMRQYAGLAAIGHVRYATCGETDLNYAQPFERSHLTKAKWFSFVFNGQLANYRQLREELTADGRHHLARDSDTEIIMHELSRAISKRGRDNLLSMLRQATSRLDGAYCLAFLNAEGEFAVARDPLGLRPMCYAVEGPLVAAASESVALSNLGFARSSIKSLPPGHALTVVDGAVSVDAFAPSPRRAHCFFEWVYFANVASTLDGKSVYLARTALGQLLAKSERQLNLVPLDDGNTIVVPVPDTSKAAADAMAFHLGVPSLEGLIRNRYSGRTFIEQGQENRAARARAKYTPLPEVMRGRRILLVEDSIVRSTTMKTLLKRVYEEGEAAEVHVRVACPPIVAPCFYGVDMSTVTELFATRYTSGEPLTDEVQAAMARELGCDSLRFLPTGLLANAIGIETDQLCQACVTGKYPTPAGQQLYEIAKSNAANGARDGQRTYEQPREARATKPLISSPY